MSDISGASGSSIDNNTNNYQDSGSENATNEDFENETAIDLRKFAGFLDWAVRLRNLLQIFEIIHEYIIAWRRGEFNH